jgi:hypothetical protein
MHRDLEVAAPDRGRGGEDAERATAEPDERRPLSSTSMYGWVRFDQRPMTSSGSPPISHWNMSIAWIAWFVRTPPPQVSQRPRQASRA